MLMDTNLAQSIFYWNVVGEYDNMMFDDLNPNRFHFANADTNFEAISPDKYTLLSNYPNPFNSMTTIVYDLKNWS